VAQVVPVVAFAVVVEVRGIANRWDETIPGWYKALQSTLWAACLLTLAGGEIIALGALRGLVAWTWWPLLCDVAIASGLVLLVVSPLLEVVVHSAAKPLARLGSMYPFARLRRWLTTRSTLRRIDRVGRRLRHTQFRMYNRLASLREIDAGQVERERQLAGLDQVKSLPEDQARSLEYLRISVPAARQQLADFRADVESDVLDLGVDIGEQKLLRANYLDVVDEYRLAWREYTEAQRAELAGRLRGFSITAHAMERAALAVAGDRATVESSVEAREGGASEEEGAPQARS
jgi:hypothetical protein